MIFTVTDHRWAPRCINDLLNVDFRVRDWRLKVLDFGGGIVLSFGRGRSARNTYVLLLLVHGNHTVQHKGDLVLTPRLCLRLKDR